MAEVATLKDGIAAGEHRERELDEEVKNLLAGIPNIPAARRARRQGRARQC